MAKVVMICGKICCGKSTYAEHLRIENNAVILSIDEIMLAIFGQYVGNKHDEYVENIEKLLFQKSTEIIETGTNVILDWGFWTKIERDFAKEYYRSRKIEYEIHYLDISDEIWKNRLDKRNRLISEKRVNAYYVDEALTKKFNSIFEPPSREEIDRWIKG